MIMRTTLTIDEDVAQKLKIEAQNDKGKNFKDIVNETLRRGLLAKRKSTKAKPIELITYSLTPVKNVSVDNIGELLEQTEGADFK